MNLIIILVLQNLVLNVNIIYIFKYKLFFKQWYAIKTVKITSLLIYLLHFYKNKNCKGDFKHLGLKFLIFYITLE